MIDILYYDWLTPKITQRSRKASVPEGEVKDFINGVLDMDKRSERIVTEIVYYISHDSNCFIINTEANLTDNAWERFQIERDRS